MPMKPPYYEITALCDNVECSTDEFRVERKTITTYTDGRGSIKTRVPCPECGRPGFIVDWKEIK